jgi:hypothetical protein
MQSAQAFQLARMGFRHQLERPRRLGLLPLLRMNRSVQGVANQLIRHID